MCCFLLVPGVYVPRNSSWFRRGCVGLMEEEEEYRDLSYIPHITHTRTYPRTAVKRSNSVDKKGLPDVVERLPLAAAAGTA